MKNKKGIEFLGEHVVNLIIAVLCIVILFYLGNALFSIFKDKQHLEQAQGSLVDISLAIKNLKNVGDSKEVPILFPNEWYISVWPRENKYPPSCQNQACICISKEVPFVGGVGSTALFGWDNPSLAKCEIFVNMNIGMNTGYFYRLLRCGASPENHYQIYPGMSLNVTLKGNNQIYFEEVC